MVAIERSGLRLKLLKEQAATGDIAALLFGDESEALTHPYLAHMWATRGADLRVEAPGQARKVAMLGVRDATSGELIVNTSVTKRSSDFVHLLETIDRRYAPAPDEHGRQVVIVLDNGPIHTSKETTRALAERPWLQVEWLPKYAPELNDIERDWRHLKRHYLANQPVRATEDLTRRILRAVATINRERADKLLAGLKHAA